MKPRRVLVLVHESLVPPEDSSGYTDQQIDAWRTEYDVMTSLRAMGHEVRMLGMGDSLAELRAAIGDWKPDLAFNLLEEFQGIVTYDQYVVAYLELMKLPYTGCNPRGMMISRDKVLSKQILHYHRIPTARFALLPRNRAYREPRRLAYPLFVKSATEDASLGISQASIVHDGAKLRERVEFIHDPNSRGGGPGRRAWSARCSGQPESRGRWWARQSPADCRAGRRPRTPARSPPPTRWCRCFAAARSSPAAG